MAQADAVAADPSFRAALRVREFRLVWLAGVQSNAGDQLARIAIVLLVYAHSGSATISALTYALTFLPALAGGVLLSGLADRYPRRQVMVTCDLIRLVLLGALALAGSSTLLIDLLLVLLVLAGSPFSAASVAVLPEVLPARNYVAGVSLGMISGQLAQLFGFAAGGACVAWLGTRNTFLLDAATFAVSAGLIRYGLAHRAAPAVEAATDAQPGSMLDRLVAGAQVVYRDRLLRWLLMLAWLPVFFIAPEAIAPAYARSLGGGATATGLLMAAMPAGTALGVWSYARRGSDEQRARAVPYLAAAAAGCLLVGWLSPNLAVSLLLWFGCGFFAAYSISVTTRFVRRTPVELRGQVVGLGSSGLIAMQGVGSVLAGLVATAWSPAAAVGVSGLAGVVSVLLLFAPLRRAERLPAPVMLAAQPA
jgi:MFS family permease